MCSRLTAAAISISLWASAAPPCRAIRIERRHVPISQHVLILPLRPKGAERGQFEVVVKGDIDNGANYPSLKDRAVFITGGGSGIGESLVEHFSAQGARVTFVDMVEAPVRALVARIAAKGQRPPDFIACDLRKICDLRAAISATGKKHGPIRVLVT